MPTTPGGLPYPTTSEAPNGPQAIQNLAEALDPRVYDTGWVDVVFQSGYQGWAGEPVKVRRVGRIVQMIGMVRGSGATPPTLPAGNTFMFTLPTGFRPAATIYADVTGSSISTSSGRVIVATSGTVSFSTRGTANSQYWSCHLSWMVD